MTRAGWNTWCGAVLALGAATGSTSRALAAELGGTTPRTDLIDYYLDDARRRPPLYQGAPVTHIVPAFNTVTYAVEAEFLDLTVLPDHLNQRSFGEQETLTLKGYTYAPYVALSLKRFGLGFNVEGGHKVLAYERSYNGTLNDDIESTLDYRGLGVYGFLKLIDGKVLTSTVIVGGKSLNARHDVVTTSNAQSYRYAINQYETGLNVGIRLIKAFTIIPWADYRYVDLQAAESQVERDPNYTGTMMGEDLQVFWNARSPLSYGLDFAVRFGRLEVHLGGILGAVVATGRQSEQVDDSGYKLSLSFDHKG